MTATLTTHQSRWGFHPCDYAKFLELKEAHLLLLTALRQVRAWQRWDLKDPQNRVLRETIRDASGRKVGHRIVGPMPEPKAPTFLYARLVRGEIDPRTHARWPNLYIRVLEAYRNARRPAETADGVGKLDLPADLPEVVAALKRFNSGM